MKSVATKQPSTTPPRRHALKKYESSPHGVSRMTATAISVAAEPIGVKHRVALGIAMLKFGERPIQEGFRIDGHQGVSPWVSSKLHVTSVIAICETTFRNSYNTAGN